MELYMTPSGGPIARYSDAHLYLALDAIKRNGSMSRKRLATELRIGEGSVRAIINLMRDWGVIVARQTGVRLTEFGEFTYESIPMRLVDAYSGKYAIGSSQQGILVKGVADKVTNGMLQRDTGIKHGASGASVFVIRDGVLIMPMEWNIDQDDPILAETIRSTGMVEGDVFLLVGSDDPISSKVAAVSIALEML